MIFRKLDSIPELRIIFTNKVEVKRKLDGRYSVLWKEEKQIPHNLIEKEESRAKIKLKLAAFGDRKGNLLLSSWER